MAALLILTDSNKSSDLMQVPGIHSLSHLKAPKSHDILTKTLTVFLCRTDVDSRTFRTASREVSPETLSTGIAQTGKPASGENHSLHFFHEGVFSILPVEVAELTDRGTSIPTGISWPIVHVTSNLRRFPQ